MKRHVRVYCAYLSCLIASLILVRGAGADAWDPPAGYYAAATGTGATLKSQLATIMTTGHNWMNIDYGDFKLISPIVDRDPNNPNNVLLVYNRASVQGAWSSGGTIWNREHVWPDSRQPGNASEGAEGAISDPHMLRPANPSINSSRGNKPFASATSSGAYGHVDSIYYFPGDTDKGDVARTLFYGATRWSSDGLSLTDSVPSGNQMGNLSSLVAWHFMDVPDEFERRRNHKVYSSDIPSLSSNNRNAYVDRPEYVWSVYVNQTNDSQITIAGGTSAGNGGTSRNVNLGRVFVESAVPAAQSFTLNKAGNNGTYFEVTTSGAAASSINGRYNAFRTNQTDSKSINVGLNTNTSTAGLRSGTVSIDNLDVTTMGGSGRGANDANDQFNVSLTVLDHATPSFDSTLTTTLMHNFGAVAMGSVSPTFDFDVFNLNTTAGYTANLDFDSIVASGNASKFSTNLAASIGSLNLAGGLSHAFSAMLDTSTMGSYSATYTLTFSDENLTGALSRSLALTLVGQVESAALAGDYNDDGVVGATDYVLWRMNYGTNGSLSNETESLGIIDDADYDAWRQNYGAVESNAGSGMVSVPEPNSAALLVIAILVGSISQLSKSLNSAARANPRGR